MSMQYPGTLFKMSDCIIIGNLFADRENLENFVQDKFYVHYFKTRHLRARIPGLLEHVRVIGLKYYVEESCPFTCLT